MLNNVIRQSSETSPATALRVLTPSDDELPEGVTKGLWIIEDGILRIIARDDLAAIPSVNVKAGTILPIQVRKLLPGTTAVVVGLYG
jgi:hypothetical protein